MRTLRNLLLAVVAAAGFMFTFSMVNPSASSVMAEAPICSDNTNWDDGVCGGGGT